MLLIAARLMAPPGICLCKVTSPAVGSFLHLLGKDVPPVAPEPVEDHDPGCPASGLSEAMGLQPPPVMLLPPLALAPVVSEDSPLVCFSDAVEVFPAGWGPADPERYLILCALLI
jgi:hypothetical protein